MISARMTIGIAALALSAATAAADPAYVTSNVNLRSAAGTTNEIVAKIPAGSLVDATNCTEWCEVNWQGKQGFAIATSLDRSGHVPAPRTARRTPPPPAGYTDDDEVVVAPPADYYAAGPGPYYYGYGYRPYYGGYGPRWGYGYGYRGGWRR